MKCAICSQESSELYDVILGDEISKVCSVCVKVENLPVIKKPTAEQLEKANHRYSVKERMMKISGLDKLHPVSKDHETAQRHLSKIKVPEKKQEVPELVENYDWQIKVGRRRKKLSVSQLSQITSIPLQVLEEIEKGKLPKNYMQIMPLLEQSLDMPILKSHAKKINFVAPEKKTTESDILQEVREKMQNKQSSREIQKGEFDFSDKEKLKNITLNDIIDAKRKLEKAGK